MERIDVGVLGATGMVGVRLVRLLEGHPWFRLREVGASDRSKGEQLGRLVADVKGIPRREFRDRYERQFMATLARIATTRRHANVLMHMAGHLKHGVDSESKIELRESIDEYRRGLVPLIVPLTLIRHHVRAQNVEYLKGQTYLEPHPRELMLRNHV